MPLQHGENQTERKVLREENSKGSCSLGPVMAASKPAPDDPVSLVSVLV